MNIQIAERLLQLPPYIFAELDRLKTEQIKKGVDLIDLGVGDPDHPTPPHVVEALKKAADDDANHHYPSYVGMHRLRGAIAEYMKSRFSVSLDLESEVLPLMGSKDGIAHFPMAFINPGDVVLAPSPGYPPYLAGTILVGGVCHLMPLKRENGFLPDLKAIPEAILQKAKIIHVNYPNNPTGSVAPKSFYQDVLALAHRYNLIVCSDAAYIEQYDGEKPISILELEGARDVAVEFHSFSKTYNMTGWRIGWVCGNRDVVAGLGKVKTNLDSGIFQAVQWAGVAALEGDQKRVEEMRALYRERRKLLVEGLKGLGLDVASAASAFYVWVAVPKNETSTSFAKKVLEKTGIVITPGNGFGDGGEGYVRFALTRDVARLKGALARLKTL